LETVEDIMAWREQRKKKWLSKIAAAVCVPLRVETDERRVRFGSDRRGRTFRRKIWTARGELQ